LKNGMYIVVTKATEKGGEIEYWVGSTKYTISKDLVAKIEPGNGPSQHPFRGSDAPRRAGSARPQPARSRCKHKNHKSRQAATAGSWWTEAARTLLDALRTRIMQGDRVNETKLAEIELDHDARTTPTPTFCGVIEMQGGDPARPVPILKTLSVRRRNRRTCSSGTPSPYLLREDMLRRLMNSSVRPRWSPIRRISCSYWGWRNTMPIAPAKPSPPGSGPWNWRQTPTTDRLLHKAERELEVEEADRDAGRATHFILHYQGDATSAELQQQLLRQWKKA